MTLDNVGRPVLTVDEIIELILAGKESHGVMVEDCDDATLYGEHAEQVLGVEPVSHEKYGSVEEFHGEMIKQWFIPEKYSKVDVLEYLVKKCSDDKELERVATEYLMFEERDMVDLLRWLMYFVDHCKENGHVIGVGRGSSVASYCLYLMGVHKINSMAYELDIKEFLK